MREVAKPKKPFSASIGSGIDALISIVSPRHGFRRAQYRTAEGILSSHRFRAGGYKSAQKSRLRSWMAGSGSADAELLPDLADLRERTRELGRNDPIAAGMINTDVTNVIGLGLKPQSQIDNHVLKLPDDRKDDLQKAAERNFRSWSKCADAGDRLDFIEMQELVRRQILESGEAFLLKRWINRPNRQWQLAFQFIEPDRVDTPNEKIGDKTVRAGVKIGLDNEPQGYYIRRTHPGDGTLSKDDRKFDYVPTFDRFGQPNVLHLYHVLRPGQTRGVPFFAPILDRFTDLADYLEAEVVAARIAACFAVFIKTQDGDAPPNMPTNSSGQRIEEMEPAMVRYLAQGEEVQIANPSRPGHNVDPFVERLLRMIGVAVGLPYELVAKDFSKVNWATARASLMEAWRFFKSERSWLTRKLCQPIWDMVQEESYLTNRIGFDDFYSYREEYCKCGWICESEFHVDPLKGEKATTESLKNRTGTFPRACASKGDDWEDVIEAEERVAIRRAESEARIAAKRKSLGLPTGDEQEAKPDESGKDNNDGKKDAKKDED